jgi:UDP-glucose 4-epimerase
MRVLVTGAAGFLGSVIVRELRQYDHEVIAASRQPERTDSGNQRLDLLGAIGPQFESDRPFDAIVHAAALLPGATEENRVFLENQQMTLQLAQWAIAQNVKHFVFLSSCSVYGYADHSCDENQQTAPKNLYALSKLQCEGIVEMIAADSGIKTTSLRISAPYGPGYRSETVVSRFLRQASRGEQLTLMGSGQRSQDFIFETDVARGVRLALQKQAAGVFNLTAGESTSMHELARQCLECYQQSQDLIAFSGQDDPQDSYRGLYPNNKANSAFGYTPEGSLRNGLLATSARFA